MQQILLEQPGQFSSRDVPEPTAGAGQALVRVDRIGVCGTDLHAFAGRQPFFEYPRVLGHELGVEVLEVPGGDHGLQPGDRCAVEPYIRCGDCPACRAGRYNCCVALEVLGVHVDGGMQPLLSVPVELLHKSEKLSLDQLALVETLGIGAHAVERASLQPGEEVLVVGAGPIGLATIQFAQAAGAKVHVLELNTARREFVDGLGVSVCDSPGEALYDAVFDATGNKQAMEASFQRLEHGGRLILIGIVLDSISFYDPLFHRREMTVLSSRNSAGVFPKIIRMIEEGRIDTAPWITHRLPLSGVPAEFPPLPEQPGLVKAMIEVDS